MQEVKKGLGRIAQSEKAVHFAWLLALLLVEATGLVVGGGGGSSGP